MIWLKALTRKIRSKAGDSLAEVMVAILIAALGASALVTMVLSATAVIGKSEAEMNNIYAAEALIASQATTDDSTVTISGAALGTAINITVQVQEDEDYDLKRYTLPRESTP